MAKYFPYITLIVFSLVGIGAFILLNDKPAEVKTNNTAVGIKPESVEDTKTVTNAEIESEAEEPGEYSDYTSGKLSAEKTNVIFFAASWCPTCQALDSKLKTQLNEIPNDLQILKADYDKETSLRQKYGVTYQHTLVQVDKDGNKIKSWSGGYDLESILSQI